jgi:hypothetical protein
MAFVIDRIDGSEQEGGRLRSAQFFLGVSNAGVAPTTYLTTGLTLNPRDFGFIKIFSVEFIGIMTAVAGVPTATARTTAFFAQFNPQTGKFQVFQGDNDGVADGPFAELPNATVIDTTAYQIRITGV